MSDNLVLKFKRLKPSAKLPQYAHSTDAAFDLFSLEQAILNSGQRHIFQIGLASEIPQGWYISLRDKSGLAVKNGLSVLGGVIDAGYRGEWGVILVNLGDVPVTIEDGDKIAQAMLEKVTNAEIVEVEELEETERGAGGFGSTGKK